MSPFVLFVFFFAMHGSVIEVEFFFSISIYVSIVGILLLKFESVLNGSELYETL